MGDLRSDNGGGWPDEGGSESHEPNSEIPPNRSSAAGRSHPGARNEPPDGPHPHPTEKTARVVPSHDDRYGLPDLPPDWGPILIPDDAAELAADASALRRERRRIARRRRVRRLLGRPDLAATAGSGQPSVGVPLVIMAVAILTTMISLFVVTWGRDGRDPSGRPPVSAGAGAPHLTAGVGVTSLTELTLSDARGAQVKFGSLLPAVVLMVDGCACDRLITDLAAVTPSSVTIIPVGRTAPHLTGVPTNVRALSDPDGALRARLAADDPTDSAATAVLLDANATVTATVARVDSTDDITAPQLARIIA